MDQRCILQLNDFPELECPLGKNLFDKTKLPRCRCVKPYPARDVNHLYPVCQKCLKPILRCCWGIKSEAHKYCFWVWMKENTRRELTDTAISQLLGITIYCAGQIGRKAIKKLKFLLNHAQS